MGISTRLSPSYAVRFWVGLVGAVAFLCGCVVWAGMPIPPTGGWCTSLGGALVSSAPTEIGWYTSLGGALVSSAPTEIGWYSCLGGTLVYRLVHDYLVGALETSAPPGRT